MGIITQGYNDLGYLGVVTPPPPVYDFSASYESGLTVYDLVFIATVGTAWNGSAFVDRSGNWGACATPMDDNGSGLYQGSMPASIPPGTYLVQSYLQLGDGPAETDPVIGTGLVLQPGPPSGRQPDPLRASSQPG